MWVDVEDGRLYVEMAGDGQPILLVHGWPLDHRMFAPQLSMLCSHFTVVTFDRRGFGKSKAHPDLRLELDDIDRILDSIDAPAAHLLGVSQGGRIALRYAATRPQRVRSLLLQGAVVDGFDVDDSGDDRVPVAQYAELARAGKLPELIEHWLRHPMMWLGDHREREYELLRNILEDYSGTDLIDYAADKYAFRHDMLAKLAEFPRPTLLLTGARETRSRRMHANELLRLIPDCRENVFSNSGHLTNLSEPTRYNQAVIDFCSEVDAC